MKLREIIGPGRQRSYRQPLYHCFAFAELELDFSVSMGFLFSFCFFLSFVFSLVIYFWDFLLLFCQPYQGTPLPFSQYLPTLPSLSINTPIKASLSFKKKKLKFPLNYNCIPITLTPFKTYHCFDYSLFKKGKKKKKTNQKFLPFKFETPFLAIKSQHI